ncbi:MAG: lysine--tRNA ligase [Candidatus Aenigmarchaeota archaeon]|nr:lysine--tRNA ligase [Candidatus Aenigmarchaeota archaeon]
MAEKSTSEKSLFWADQLAGEIIVREKYRYLDKKAPKLNKFVVKTSASLSGVLHIGRLSDTIRGESVFRALEDAGAKAELIWVAEHMDPLRKVPKGVPREYIDYIGVPVTDVPDPEGCHKSYADHHVAEYFKVLDDFVSTGMKKYSMREEYKRGSFREQVKSILENAGTIIEIQNRYRQNKLGPGWSPWAPICGNCRKIITPRVAGFERGKVHYKCEDYKFEEAAAKGCGYEGESDPLKGEGKLLWKSEWAAQWAHWQVASEGAGKEYQVPGSAFWINAEIVEKALDFPSPFPIFYEHIMVDGEKMSASKGNIVYPRDWLAVADAELLRFFYNKKLMKTRSFSWKDLPNLHDDYDRHGKVYFGDIEIENRKEKDHMKRLFEISQMGKPRKRFTMPFDFAAMIGQVIPETRINERVLSILKSTGHLEGRLDKEEEKYLETRMGHARTWAEKYAPPEARIAVQDKVSDKIRHGLSAKQKQCLKEIIPLLEKETNEKQLHDAFWEIAKKHDITPKELFAAAYMVLLGEERGPRLAPFMLAVGKERVIKLLKEL